MKHFTSSISRILLIAVMLFSQTAASIPYFGGGSVAEANWIYDNSSGTVTIDLRNNLAGISGGTNYVHNGIAPGTIESGGGAADIRTSNVSVESIQYWETMTVVHSGGDLQYEILECNNTPITTQTAYTGPVDLNQPEFASFDCLRGKLYFTDPVVIDDIIFDWKALPEAEIILSPDYTEITAGTCSDYTVSIAQSYYDEEDTAVYVQLPYYDPSTPDDVIGYDVSTIDDALGQFPFSNLVVGDIGLGGQWNNSNQPLVLPSGLEVPAHAVYRDTAGELGSSALYSFTLCSDVGTQYDIGFDMTATIYGTSGYTKESNTIETYIYSQAELLQGCVSSPHNIITNAIDKTVEYTISTRSIRTEDVFNSVFYIYYEDPINYLQGCGLTETEALARITLPAGFSDISGDYESIGTAAHIYSKNNDLYGVQDPQVIDHVTTIDYTGCADQDTVELYAEAKGENTARVDSSCYLNFQTVCGDGERQDPNTAGQAEECDEGEDNSDTGTCTTTCRNTVCGDGILQSPNSDAQLEVCDDGVNNGDDKACSSTCELTFCGDGVVQLINGAGEEEQCDGGVECDATCQWIPVCGNLRIENGEDCDDGINNADDATCNTECKLTTCGDGVVQTPNGAGFEEICDDGNDVNDDECTNGCVLPGGGSGSGGGTSGSTTGTTTGSETDPSFTNKCMFTTTSHDEINTGDYEGIAAEQGVTFYDSECLDSGVATIDMQEDGETFYHLNYQGKSNNMMRQGIYSLDRIDEAYVVQGGDIWTDESSSWTEETDSAWAVMFCHADTGMTAPAYDATVLDGTVTPDATAVGAGWSTICDENSRWVLSTMKCLNDTNADPVDGSVCDGAPTRYQFRIGVEPVEISFVECSDEIVPDISVSNTADVYVSSMGTIAPLTDTSSAPIVTVSQSSEIININPFAALSSGIIDGFTTKSTIAAEQTQSRIYQRENTSNTVVDGDIVIQFDMVDGQCPTVDGFPAGYIYDNQTCTLTGPVPPVGNTDTALLCEDDGTLSEVLLDKTGRELYRANYERNGSSWIGISKTENAYDEYGNRTIRAYYTWNDVLQDREGSYKNVKVFESSWDGSYRRNQLTSSMSYVRDTVAGDWIVDTKSETIYSEFLHSYYGPDRSYSASSKRIDGEWKIYDEYQTEYDDMGRNLFRKSERKNQDTFEIGFGEITYTDYDEYGNLLRDFVLNYDLDDGAYYPFTEENNVHDEYGYQMSKEEKTNRNPSSSTWDVEETEFLNEITYTTAGVPNFATGFRYEDNGGVLVVDAYIEVEISEVDDIHYVDEYIYNGLDDSLPALWNRTGYKEGDVGSYVEESYTRDQIGQLWVGLSKTIIEGETTNKVTHYEAFIRSSRLNDWETLNKYITEYDENGNILLSESYNSYANPGPGPRVLRRTYAVYNEYNAEGELISSVQKNSEDIVTRIVRYESENGKQTLREELNFSSVTGIQSGGHRNTYSYNNDGNVLEEIYERYDAQSSTWNNDRNYIKTYIYNSDGYIVSEEKVSNIVRSGDYKKEREYDEQGYLINYKKHSFQYTQYPVGRVVLSEDSTYTASTDGISVIENQDCTPYIPVGIQGIAIPLYVTYPTGTDTILTTTAGYNLDYCNMADDTSQETNYQGTRTGSAPTPFVSQPYVLPTIPAPTPIVIPVAETFVLPEPLPSSLLITEKYLDTDLIAESGDGIINYTLQIYNAGEKSENDIYIIDPLPAGVELVSVKTSGAIAPNLIGSSGSEVTPASTQYNCPNNGIGDCSVLFAETVDPTRPSVSNPYDANTIGFFFQAGMETSDGWVSNTLTLAAADVHYAAVHIPSLEVGQYALIQVQVKNTANVRGDIIKNSVSTISRDLLPSISNSVYTTLLPAIPNTIDGVVYEDANDSGFLDGGEELFAGVSVFLMDSDGNEVATTTTNEDGVYFFGSLADGEYTVTHDPSIVTNYTSISSNAGSIDDVVMGTEAVDLLTIESIMIAGGANSLGNNFGLIADTVSVGGTVYFDDENDDIYTGDAGLAGLTVVLYDINGDVVTTQETDVDGSYVFDDLRYGTYTVVYNNTTIYTADSSIVGSIDAVTTGMADGVERITDIVLMPSDHSIDNDFGLIDPATSSLAGSIYFDDEKDDLYMGDLGLAGYEVTLVDSSENIISTTTTDVDGSYIFTGLFAGAYTVSYDATSSEHLYVADSNIPGAVTLEGVAGTATNVTTISAITLSVNRHSEENDFGLVDPGTSLIRGTVYFDDENDDVYTGDQGLELYEVTLMDSTGTEIANMMTNEFGMYEFTNLEAGDYVVSYNPVHTEYGYIADSVIAGNQAVSTSITVIAVRLENVGDVSENNDFGLIDPGLSSLAGSIYFDDEDNDVYMGDQGLAGYEVSLLDTNGNVLATTTTAADGLYKFVGLAGGTYTVSYDKTSSEHPYIADSNRPGVATPEGLAGTTENDVTISSIMIAIDEHSAVNDFGLVRFVPPVSETRGGGATKPTPPVVVTDTEVFFSSAPDPIIELTPEEEVILEKIEIKKIEIKKEETMEREGLHNSAEYVLPTPIYLPEVLPKTGVKIYE